MGLVVGNVVIGRRDEGTPEGSVKKGEIGLGEATGGDERSGYRDEDRGTEDDLGYETEDDSNLGRTHG